MGFFDFAIWFSLGIIFVDRNKVFSCFDVYFKFSFRQLIPILSHVVFVEEFHKLIDQIQLSKRGCFIFAI